MKNSRRTMAATIIRFGFVGLFAVRSTMAAAAAAAVSAFNADVASAATTTNRRFPPTAKIAIARTLSLNDAAMLPGSFEGWSAFPPCAGGGDHRPTYSADLYLSFSQFLGDPTADRDTSANDEPRANASAVGLRVMEAVASMFRSTNGWGNCIDRVFGFGCDIAPNMDLYKIGESGTNPLWVNGPNRQFECTMRAIQRASGGPYDATFLMEMDSVPVKPFWLDLLVDEIDNRQSDFAILGSKYRGYKWDLFYSKLEPSLVNHINGNAVYNHTHPVLNRLLDVLESEAETVGNTIPYDYRISQIVTQAQSDVEPHFEEYFVNQLELRTPPPVNDAEIFGLEGSDTDVIRETILIGNYASTNMLKAFFDPREVIIHGAKLRRPWDSEKLGNTTLVVSDWNDTNSLALLSTLDDCVHPFSEVVVLLPDGVDSIPIGPIRSAVVRFVSRRQSPDYMDICTAPVRTDWFMKTDSTFRLRPVFRLMVHHTDGDDSHKPLASFCEAVRETCFAFPYCVKEFEVAKRIDPTVHRIFTTNDFVFETRSRDEYCQAWDGAFGPKAPPSATSYVAFLRADGRDEAIYHFSERRMDGMPSAFLRLPRESLAAPLKRRQMQQLGSGENSTDEDPAACSEQTSDETCVAAGCEWAGFGCRAPNQPASPPPTVASQQQSQASRPGWATSLMVVAIASGAITLLCLLAFCCRRRRNAGTTSSSLRAVVNGGSEFHPINREGGDSGSGSGRVDSSLYLVSDDNTNEGSLRTADLRGLAVLLDDGTFEENSIGVEFVKN